MKKNTTTIQKIDAMAKVTGHVLQQHIEKCNYCRAILRNANVEIDEVGENPR